MNTTQRRVQSIENAVAELESTIANAIVEGTLKPVIKSSVAKGWSDGEVTVGNLRLSFSVRPADNLFDRNTMAFHGIYPAGAGKSIFNETDTKAVITAILKQLDADRVENRQREIAELEARLAQLKNEQ